MRGKKKVWLLTKLVWQVPLVLLLALRQAQFLSPLSFVLLWAVALVAF